MRRKDREITSFDEQLKIIDACERNGIDDFLRVQHGYKYLAKALS